MTPTITSVRLVNIGPFADVTVPFLPALRGPDCGQVLAVVGSVGKTTFLRAVALALVPRATAAPYCGSGVRMLKSMEPRAEVRVECGGGAPNVGYILCPNVGGREVVGEWRGYVSKDEGAFVVAYGAHRNRPDQLWKEPSPRVSTHCGGLLMGTAWDAIASLFSDRGMCSVWDVLSGLRRFERLPDLGLRNVPAARVADMRSAYRAVTAALSSAAGVDVKMGETDVLVGGEQFRHAGDGVRGRLRWVTDMLAKWIDREWRAGREVGEDFAGKMDGVCIVDAFDEAMTPRQQKQALSLLRDTFPRMSFVVSVYAEPAIRPFGIDEVVVFDREFGPRLAPSAVEVITGDAAVERSADWSW